MKPFSVVIGSLCGFVKSICVPQRFVITQKLVLESRLIAAVLRRLADTWCIVIPLRVSLSDSWLNPSTHHVILISSSRWFQHRCAEDGPGFCQVHFVYLTKLKRRIIKSFIKCIPSISKYSDIDESCSFCWGNGFPLVFWLWCYQQIMGLLKHLYF